MLCYAGGNLSCSCKHLALALALMLMALLTSLFSDDLVVGYFLCHPVLLVGLYRAKFDVVPVLVFSGPGGHTL